MLCTESQQSPLNTARGREGCGRACTQTGSPEQPVGGLSPGRLPLIPFLPHTQLFLASKALSAVELTQGLAKMLPPRPQDCQHPLSVT